VVSRLLLDSFPNALQAAETFHGLVAAKAPLATVFPIQAQTLQLGALRYALHNLGIGKVETLVDDKINQHQNGEDRNQIQTQLLR